MLKLKTYGTGESYLIDSFGTPRVSCCGHSVDLQHGKHLIQTAGRNPSIAARRDCNGLLRRIDGPDLRYYFKNAFGDGLGEWCNGSGTVYVSRYANGRRYRREFESRDPFPFDEWLECCLDSITIDPPTSATPDSPVFNSELLNRYYRELMADADSPLSWVYSTPPLSAYSNPDYRPIWITTDDTL